MGKDIDRVLNGILSDYKAIALEAVEDAAHKGQEDIIKEAKKYLQYYYDSYDPKHYIRQHNLKNAITPIFNNKSIGGNIAIEIGVEYIPENLNGLYKGVSDPTFILDNFLIGEHGGAQRDFNGTYTLMPNFYDNELQNIISKHVQNSLFNSIISRL